MAPAKKLAHKPAKGKKSPLKLKAGRKLFQAAGKAQKAQEGKAVPTEPRRPKAKARQTKQPLVETPPPKRARKQAPSEKEEEGDEDLDSKDSGVKL